MKTILLLAGTIAVAFLAACDEKKETTGSGADSGQSTGTGGSGTGSSDPDTAPAPPPQVDPAPAPAPAPRPAPAPAPSDTVASLADEVGAQLEVMATMMSKVTDKASAESAAEGLKTISTEIDGIATRLQKLPQPSAEERKAIAAKIEAQQAALEEKLGAPGDFMEKLSPEAQDVFEEAMRTFTTDMMEAGAIFEQYFEEEKEDPVPPEPPVEIPDPEPGSPAPEPTPLPE